jgi:hypothetical protein
MEPYFLFTKNVEVVEWRKSKIWEITKWSQKLM